MDSITPEKINEMLGQKALQLAKHLLPNGKLVSGMWQVGSVDGETGKSCKVYLSGGGGYCDFAGNIGGDYIKLWMETRRLGFKEAFSESKQWLGVYEVERKKTFKKPIKPKSLKSIKEDQSKDYLKNQRLFSDNTISKFKITQCELYGKPAIFFPYLVDGELIHFKQRLITPIENKSQYIPSKDTEACLFGWQALTDERKEFIIICEGEYDAMAYSEYGYEALSVPFGGGDKGKQNWVENEYVRLSQFNTIYLSMDMDKEGSLAVDELIKRLGIDRCRIVSLPKKDANDCLKSGVSKEVIDNCIAKAKYKSMAELKSPLDFMDETLDWMYPDAGQEQARGFDTPWSDINSEWRPMWGELTLINGINAHGKSEFANLFALHAATKLNIPSFVASMEIPNKRLNERFVKQLTASMKPAKSAAKNAIEFLHEKVWIGDFKESVNQNKLIEAMNYAYKRYGVKVFLIDSLMKCGVDEEDNTALKLFVERLCEFKNNFMTHIFLVVHPRKGVNEDSCPNKMDVLGTGGVTNLADNLITVWRNKKREQAEKEIKEKRITTPDYEQTLEQARKIQNDSKRMGSEPDLDKKQAWILKGEEYLEKTAGVIAWLQKHRNGGNERQFKLDYKNHQHINFRGINKHYIQSGGKL